MRRRGGGAALIHSVPPPDARPACALPVAAETGEEMLRAAIALTLAAEPRERADLFERLTGDIAAATHPDPYPFYARLGAEAPLYRDDALGLWVAASAAAVNAALTHGLCRVRPPAEPVPRALAGSPAGEIFGRLVRMTDGEER